MGLLLLTGDSSSGALLGTHGAALTLFRIDDILDKALAVLGGALLVPDVSIILIPEVLNGGKYGVGSSLTQAAQSAVLDAKAQLFQQLYVAFLALALGDPGQDLQHPLGAQTAGDTLTAGFLGGEVQEELGHTNQVFSSMTTIPPEPMIAPVAPRAL